MKKIDIIQDGMNTLKVEFDVYAKLFGNQLINLNLTVCGKSKILIFIPFILNDNIDKYNSSSGYYNDICYITTSEYGTDIILKDRKNEFINKNRIICQEDCDFSDYDYETLVAKCSCDVKECAEEFADMKIDKNILNNIGCYILFLINIFHIFSILIFSGKQFSQLKKKIKAVIYEKKMIKKNNKCKTKKNYTNKN